MVAHSAQKLSEVRQEIKPLTDNVKPIKDEYQTIKQQYEQKKRVFEATSINITSQMEPLKNQVQKLTDQINNKEEEWKSLRQKITKAESLQEVVANEMKNAMQSPRRPSKMEELKQKVSDLEMKVKHLEEVLFCITLQLLLSSTCCLKKPVPIRETEILLLFFYGAL